MIGHKASDNVLVESYKRLGSVWKVGEEIGMAGQSVHSRLQKLNVIEANHFTKEDLKILKESYLTYRDIGALDDLAKKMNRSKHFICRKARGLGLTDQKHKKAYASTWKIMEEPVAKKILEKYKHSNLNRKDFCKRHGLGVSGFENTLKRFFPAEYEAIMELKHSSPLYKKGRALEYKVRNVLKEHGYFAIRSAGSKIPVDVVGFKENELLFIQCKNCDVWHQVKDWNEFYLLCISVSAKPIVALKGYKFKEIVKEKDRSRREAPWIDFFLTMKEE